MSATVSLLAAAAFAAGNWNVTFNEKSGELALSNRSLGIEVSGRTSFTANGGQAWTVAAPRDAVTNRLALVDARGDVQGYVSFQADGNRLGMLVYHRTAQSYPGTLGYRGTIAFRPESFACRTIPAAGERVLSLGSGAADSLKNDSLFAREEDLAFRLRAADLSLKTLSGGRYAFAASGRIEESAEATFGFEPIPHYYRDRYIPYYKPIDRARCPRVPTGWMSWNTYFDQATDEDNLDEARIGKKYLQPFGMEFWSIESWQGNSPKLPVGHFYNMNLETDAKKFPMGMKRVAQEIKALGFRPGLWMAPFGTGNAEFYAAHKDWFLHDAAGKPVSCWNGTYTLDPTAPGALEHLKHIFDVASHDWGYEYFKIDGMSGRDHGYCAHLYERPEIRARFHDPSCPNPFERCVRAFREGIGPDRVFLACQGHFTGAETAFADSSRTGADIVSPNCPVGWPNIMSQAHCTENQVFAHNIVFFADPDTLLVNDALGIEQARVTTTIVSLPGQVMFSGDKLAKLAPERMRLLQQALPVADVHPMELYPYFHDLPVWTLAVVRPFIRYRLVALFNWGNAPAKIGCDMAEIGENPEETFTAYEFWTNTGLGDQSGRIEMEVPAHGVRLVALHRAEAHPQFVSSDRHVTQGAVELKDLGWKDSARELDSTFQVIGGFPMTARFRVPAGYKLASCEGPAGVELKTAQEPAGILAVTISAPATREVPLRLRF